MSRARAASGLGDSALIVVLAALIMIGALGVDTYLPSFHAIGEAFEATPIAVQQTLSVYMATTAVTVLLAGTLSDSFGRRPLVLLATLLFALGSVAALAAPDMPTLIAARAVQGVAGGITMVLARAIVQDRFEGAEAQRAMALLMLVFGVGPAFAPIFGGWLQAGFGWRSIFVFLAAYGAMLWLICQWSLPETLPPHQRASFRPGSILAGYGRALTHRRFVLKAAGIGLIFIGLALHISSASAYVIDILGLDEKSFGWLFIPMIGGSMLGSVAAERLARRVEASRLTVAGFTLMLIGTLVAVAYTSVFEARIPYAVAPLAVYTFGLSLASPGMIVQTLGMLPDARGLAASLLSFVQMLVFALVAGFVAPLVFHSAQSLALTHLTGILLGMILWFLAGWLEAAHAPAAQAAGTAPAGG